MENRKLYKQERVYRWGVAKEKEPIVAKEIEEEINRITEQKNKIERYDEKCFEEFPIEDFEWIKGAADYAINMNLFGETSCMYCEIKIKKSAFGATIRGIEKTKSTGAKITKYGCASYYLDIDPVYKNMNIFCERFKIQKNSFIIFFKEEDTNEINFISLEKINELVVNGWYSEDGVIEICEYTEGYGAKSYLIPKKATKRLDSIRGIEQIRPYCESGEWKLVTQKSIV